MGYNMKHGNSGVKFKNLGSSPTKHTEKESGFSHQHPHTKEEEKIASSRKKVDKFWVKKGNALSVVPDEMEELQEMGTEFEKGARERQASPNKQKGFDVKSEKAKNKRDFKKTSYDLGTPGWEPPVRREELDEKGKKIYDAHRAKKKK